MTPDPYGLRDLAAGTAGFAVLVCVVVAGGVVVAYLIRGLDAALAWFR